MPSIRNSKFTVNFNFPFYPRFFNLFNGSPSCFGSNAEEDDPMIGAPSQIPPGSGSNDQVGAGFQDQGPQSVQDASRLSSAIQDEIMRSPSPDPIPGVSDQPPASTNCSDKHQGNGNGSFTKHSFRFNPYSTHRRRSFEKTKSKGPKPTKIVLDGNERHKLNEQAKERLNLKREREEMEKLRLEAEEGARRVQEEKERIEKELEELKETERQRKEEEENNRRNEELRRLHQEQMKADCRTEECRRREEEDRRRREKQKREEGERVRREKILRDEKSKEERLTRAFQIIQEYYLRRLQDCEERIHQIVSEKAQLENEQMERLRYMREMAQKRGTEFASDWEGFLRLFNLSDSTFTSPSCDTSSASINSFSSMSSDPGSDSSSNPGVGTSNNPSGSSTPTSTSSTSTTAPSSIPDESLLLDNSGERILLPDTKPTSIEQCIQLYREKWDLLRSGNLASGVARFSQMPWPMLYDVEQVEHITPEGLVEFLHHLVLLQGKSPRKMLQEEIRRWHTDKIESTVLEKFVSEDRPLIKDAANHITIHLLELKKSLNA